MAASLTQILDDLEAHDEMQNAAVMQARQQAEMRRRKEAETARAKAEKGKKSRDEEPEGVYPPSFLCFCAPIFVQLDKSSVNNACRQES